MCVGPKAVLIAEAAKEAGMDKERVWHFADATTAATAIPQFLRAGDLVLLKASRAIRLEDVAKALFQGREQPTALKVAS